MVVWLSERCNSILKDRFETKMLTIWSVRTFYFQVWYAKLKMDGMKWW